MIRRSARALWPLVLLILALSCRANGCRKKPAAATIAVPPGSPPYRITILMTPPPVRPTVTIWKGATPVPQLPE